jgi:hypothetical protein
LSRQPNDEWSASAAVITSISGFARRGIKDNVFRYLNGPGGHPLSRFAREVCREIACLGEVR